MLGGDHLLAKRFGEPAYGEFRRVVPGLSGHRNSPNTLEMLITCPSPEAIRCGRNTLVPLTTPPEVDVHHALDVPELADFDVTGERDARVVVDLVDLAEVLLDIVGVGDESFAFSDIQAIRLDRRAESFRLSSVNARPSVSMSLIASLAPDLPSSMASAWPMRTGSRDDRHFSGESLHRCSSELTSVECAQASR